MCEMLFLNVCSIWIIEISADIFSQKSHDEDAADMSVTYQAGFSLAVGSHDTSVFSKSTNACVAVAAQLTHQLSAA